MSARRALALLVALPLACVGVAFGADEDDDERQWQEEKIALPDFPRDEDLMPFDVSAGTPHRYFIDGKSIAAGGDGVVRFALVVKTAGGSTNVTYEGLRCATLEYRLYATGRAGGNWTKARNSEWKRIEKKPVNGYHAALSRDYFCPALFPIRSAEEGRRALELGRHPDAK